MSEYPEFLNGKDIPNEGLNITINKVKRFVNDKRDDGFAGFFVEIQTDILGLRTISASFGSVLEDMLMQKLENVSFKLYRYDKGDKSYISTQKPKSSNSNQAVQQTSSTSNTPRRYGR